MAGPGNTTDCPGVGKKHGGSGPRTKKQLRVIRLSNENERRRLRGFPDRHYGKSKSKDKIDANSGNNNDKVVGTRG